MRRGPTLERKRPLLITVACVGFCMVPVLDGAVLASEGSTTSQIAYGYQPMTGGIHQIYLIRADGTGNPRLIDAPIGLNHHIWSAHGQRLAAVGYPHDATWSIYTFSVDGVGLTRLTATFGVWDSDPAWSPNGERISFTRIYPDRGDREELWMMGADGSDARWIEIEGSGAQWSPDGSRLVFTAERGGVRDIYTCAPDGTGESRPTSTASVEALPSWSPGGSRIAFASSSDGSYAAWEIFVMSAQGADVRQLTANTAYDSCPRWSPDGAMLCFESDRSQNQHWEVYVMGADGSDVTRTTQLPASATAIHPVWRS